MAISKALEAKILRYHFVEHWGPHTIATQLGIHHSAVDRVLSQAGMPKAERTRQASIIDPYIPFIIETLEQYPTLTATRLYAMAQQRGYQGGSSHFRSHVAQLRPRKPSEAYCRTLAQSHHFKLGAYCSEFSRTKVSTQPCDFRRAFSEIINSIAFQVS